MPSQLVKCAFGFSSFNDPKTKCAHLSVELGSEQGVRAPPPNVVGPACLRWNSRLLTNDEVLHYEKALILNVPMERYQDRI